MFSKSSSTKSRRRSTRKRTSSVLQVTAAGSSAPVGLPAGAFFLFGGLCLLMLGWGVWLFFGWMGDVLFTGNQRFTLQRLEARSNGVLPEAILLEWSGLEKGINLYEVDLKEVTARMERHPIIRRAVVRRHLPDRLTVAVYERVPLARTGRVEGRMNWLVDEEGVLIQKSFQSKHLPFLLGAGDNLTLGQRVAEGPAGPALAYLALLKEMPGKIRSLLPVHVISLGHPDYLDVRLKNGLGILLPKTGDFENILMEASRGIYEIQNQNLDLTVLDMRPEGRNKIGAAL